MLQKYRWPPQLLDRKDPRQYLGPHPLLRPYIAHYTLYYPGNGSDAPSHLQIIPDASGCMIFTVGDRLEARILGASSHAERVPNRATPPRFFVEFLPGGEHRLLHLPLPRLQDSSAPLEAALPLLYKQIATALERCENTRQLCAEVDAAFLPLLAGRPEHHPIVSALLSAQPGQIPSIEALAQYSCYSHRHISRVVKEHLGIGPKPYLRLLRINRLVAQLPSHNASLTQLAHQAGYFDQAHFTHDFKTVCGVPPSHYLQNLSYFYNEPFKF